MIDLRPELPPVRDQGRRSTCVAFAGTANHEWLRRDGETLSVEFLHWAAKARDGLAAGTSGTTLRAATRALADIGQPPEPSWPYDDSRDDRAPAYGPPAGACEAAQQRRLIGGTPLAPTAGAIRAVLEAGRVVLLGLRVHATWHFVPLDGRIAMPPPGAASLGGHAVLVVGFNDAADPSGGHFIVRNSWGADWGDAGYGHLPLAYVDTYGIAAWDLT